MSAISSLTISDLLGILTLTLLVWTTLFTAIFSVSTYHRTTVKARHQIRYIDQGRPNIRRRHCTAPRHRYFSLRTQPRTSRALAWIA